MHRLIPHPWYDSVTSRAKKGEFLRGNMKRQGSDIRNMGTMLSHRQVTCSTSSILAPTVILPLRWLFDRHTSKDSPRPEAFPGLIAFGFYIHYSVFPPKLLNIRRPRHAGVASGGPATTLPWPTWHKTLSTDCQALSQAVTTPMSGA